MMYLLRESDYNYLMHSNDELYHYGVLGMRWGHRKRRYTMSDRINNYVGYRKNIRRNVKNAKGLGKKMSARFGYGRRAEYSNYLARTKARKRDNSITKLGRRYHETGRINVTSFSDYYKKMQKASAGKKIVETFIPIEGMKVPIKRLSGRSTTYGKYIADTMFTGGTVGLALDAKHIIKEHKKAK